MTSRIVIGDADAALDQLLSDELDVVNAAAVPGPVAERGARRVFVTSFIFQAPGFYEKHGYREIFRWDGVPVAGQADVHLRKDL